MINWSKLWKTINSHRINLYANTTIVNFIFVFRQRLPPYQQTWDKVRLLMSFWRLPSLYFDDIEECICEQQDKTIVKRNLIAKLVPRQVNDRCEKIIRQVFQTNAKKLNIENKVSLKTISSVRTWFETYRAPSYQAARKAIIQVDTWPILLICFGSLIFVDL